MTSQISAKSGAGGATEHRSRVSQLQMRKNKRRYGATRREIRNAVLP